MKAKQGLNDLFKASKNVVVEVKLTCHDNVLFIRAPLLPLTEVRILALTFCK